MARREYDKHGNQCYYRGSVQGTRDVKDVAGIFDEDFKVRVHAYIDGRDFCAAVRRCLIHDLVQGALDDNDNCGC